jgi:uncharacterized metal-binding protein
MSQTNKCGCSGSSFLDGKDDKNCECASAPKLIFACSGASDVGAIADQAGRKLASEGVGKFYCLARIGGRVSGIMASTEAASDILVIEGCNLDCARRVMELAGFKKFKYLRVTDLGMKKGVSPATAERVAEAAAKGKEILSAKE